MKVSAAAAPPRKLATRKIQSFDHATIPIAETPTATAGLKAPTVTLPIAKAPASTVNPIARP